MHLLLLVAALSTAELEERGRMHLYNMEYAQARAIFAELTEKAPSSPVGPYYEATTLWMEEFTKRGGMAGSTFRTGRYWGEKNRQPIDDDLDREFKALVAESVSRADALLAKDDEDKDALFFRGSIEGVLSAYHVAVEHKYYQSYKAGKRARNYHQLLLEIDPDYADACLLPGIYEYTIATLPRTLKFAGFLIGLRGSREKGKELVERAVREGERTKWVARLSLSVLYQRDKEYGQSLRMLRELESEFPRNPLLMLERGNVQLLRKNYRGARSAFTQVQLRQRADMPNFGEVDPALVQLKLAESYLFAKEFKRANQELNRTLEIPDIAPSLRAVVFLRRGMASDGLGSRKAAEWDYRRALDLDADDLTNKLAKRYLSKPAFR